MVFPPQFGDAWSPRETNLLVDCKRPAVAAIDGIVIPTILVFARRA